MKQKLIPPVSYQGGKQRLSEKIVNIMLDNNNIDRDTKFYDLCSGSGAISLELVNRGIDPVNITMVDKGDYGTFWKLVSEGTFDYDLFTHLARQIQTDKSKIKGFFEQESNKPVDENYAYKYLFLQAGAFGGKQIWTSGNKWMNASFRDYWQPTESSSRRNPVNPMQPMTETIIKRVDNILERDLKFNVINDDIYKTLSLFSKYDNNAIIYIDPPYKNTSGYKDFFDWEDFLGELFNTVSSPIYVSECAKYSDDAILLNINNKKGGINGNKKKGKKRRMVKYIQIKLIFY